MTQYATIKYYCECGKKHYFSGETNLIDKVVCTCSNCGKNLNTTIKETLDDLTEFIRCWGNIFYFTHDQNIIKNIEKMYELYRKKIIVD